MSLSNTLVFLLAVCACALGTAPPTLLSHIHHHSSAAPLSPSETAPVYSADKMVMDQPKEDMDHDHHKDMDMDMDMDMGNMTHMMMVSEQTEHTSLLSPVSTSSTVKSL